MKTMKIGSILLLSTLVVLTFANAAASVFLPKSMKVTQQGMRSLTNSESSTIGARHDLRWAIRQQQQQQQRRSSGTTAMAIPGYGVAEQVLVGGFANFLSIYNLIITARILLSWFPQAQGVAALEPVYAITDPFLNLFRGVIPPIFGLDFSPILAFVLLNVLTSATSAVGYEMTPEMSRKWIKKGVGRYYFPSQTVSPSQYNFAKL